jgi:uncharacterized protein
MTDEKVLITGGSGLIGSKLSELLINRRYEVAWLSRKSGNTGGIRLYQWDYKSGKLDQEAIQDCNYIVHLAGASVGDKRWSKEYKKEILESRTKSTALLFDYVKKFNPALKAFIGGSAVGIYGADRGEEWLKEDAGYGDDFLAKVVKEWEAETEKFTSLGIRTVKIRTGVVLSDSGGALEKMVLPIKMHAGAALGSGKQYVPWIHIDDLCEIFIKAIEDQRLSGAYNAAAPSPVTNEQLTKEIGRAMGKSIILPNVPTFVLKLALGEFSSSVLGSEKVSSEKIQKAGYQFRFSTVDKALNDLLSDS